MRNHACNVKTTTISRARSIDATRNWVYDTEIDFLERYSKPLVTTMQPIDDEQLVTTYTSFRHETGASADSILVNPFLRNRFLDMVRRQTGEVEEEPVLRRLLNLRKRQRLPRR